MRFPFHPGAVPALLLSASLLGAVSPAPNTQTVTVRNKLNINRSAETISIPASRLAVLVKKYGAKNLLVKDASGKAIVSQAVDNNGDGTVDELLFQTDIKANASQKFTITGAANAAAQQPKSPYTTFARLVPERTDDYTWENDRVAFRTYGPEAERLVVAKQPGGTLTSGMDCWLKRVPYPIIDKWYAGHVKEAGFYHKDRGEGYDPYHVGDSRGFAGIGIWENDSLYVSRNFTGTKTLANGPIRTLFELSYAPWQAGGRTVTEKKILSIDLGSNLTRFEEHISADKPLPNVTIGTTLHAEPKGVRGEVKGEPQQGWFRYWEPMDDAFVGTGVVLAPGQVQNWKDHRTKAKEQSHLLVIATPQANKLVYYAGFGWTKSNQFKTAAEWDQYLATYAKRLASPLEVTY
ncbi:DUF4861 domain-containing protein [Hymenobacter sp. BT186]|uniref:DUF4861 domain-containing protein n=1 Tax=Hymenobacter telluris TaxID=2816474 RepID=A0A939ESR1_9BACT|nr:DUF4861 domain-containing protein [Hymenobacter telluris]MBO0356641.1 DUF4861 domain-containing protein [Hymenobacter telluris]MBW3372666.1 DUF4861 domain-containing protein [Hymenobacter norwichensis]